MEMLFENAKRRIYPLHGSRLFTFRILKHRIEHSNISTSFNDLKGSGFKVDFYTNRINVLRRVWIQIEHLLSDLTIDTFLILRDTFFHPDGKPKQFNLRKKSNTQDDPLDNYIVSILKNLQGATCQKSSGPLINPDLVVYRCN